MGSRKSICLEYSFSNLEILRNKDNNSNKAGKINPILKVKNPNQRNPLMVVLLQFQEVKRISIHLALEEQEVKANRDQPKMFQLNL